MNDLVPVGDKSFTDDFVVEIQVQGAVADHELEKSRDIGSKHLAGVVRHHRRKIERPENRDSLVNDGFPGASKLTVAATLRYDIRSEEHTSELQSQSNLVCRLLLEKKKKQHRHHPVPP